LNEFELIQRYFWRQTVVRQDVAIAIGDDAAVIDIPAGYQLVVSTDVLVEGVHFPSDAAAQAIGHKALAVNLSDMAAMGAEPAWFTLNLSLPDVDENWLEAFCRGMFDLAGEYNVQLIGGDTVKGPRTIGIQINGLVPTGQALTRSGAASGDYIYVTGTLGDAALALAHHQGKLTLTEDEQQKVSSRLHTPEPRVRIGQGLRGIANSAIDISDGLAADLGHILEMSKVGARLNMPDIPLSSVYRTHFEVAGGYATAVGFGDDYELCITVPGDKTDKLESIGLELGCRFYLIGEIESEAGIRWITADGERWEPPSHGYSHFR